MKKVLSLTVLAMTLALSAAASAAPVGTKKVKPSAAHVAAVKKCDEEYRAAVKEARTKKGKERKESESAARQARKQCVASAPK